MQNSEWSVSYKKGSRNREKTPTWLLKQLYDVFDFDFDPCPIEHKFDGLKIDWGKRNYVNPPYSEKRKWILKAIEQQKKGKLTVMLLPVDTSTRWFNELILPNCQIIWLKERMRLDNNTHPMYATLFALFVPNFTFTQRC